MADIKFLADVHLGRVAKYLRLLGFDTLYFTNIEDNKIIEIAKNENRIVLTKDKILCERLKKSCYLVKSKKPIEQIKEIAKHFDLKKYAKPFTRCIKDNALLEDIEKSKIEDKLPPKVKKFYNSFKICPKCHQIYWLGSHYEKMEKFIKELLDY
ncbi:Mut7-C RNAse domain-containing protein [Nitrosophilus kaiyonis]|uniref:Mut7-C RNAse domain-containing protein n=1 Tax=Nitrosophilus kaiyonis TaxID=2930200 RepID=UPI00249211E0|nr:Mut7-C RNAse domain-containing protein [Nitrosophilus kaiyonis]